VVGRCLCSILHRQQSGEAAQPNGASPPSPSASAAAVVTTGLSGDARELERLVDEFAQADGLDRRRRERLARLIVETAQRSGLRAKPASAPTSAPTRRCAASMPGSAISRTSRQRRPARLRPGTRVGCGGAVVAGECRRRALRLIVALDGRRVAPGPAGAPARGRAMSCRPAAISSPPIAPAATPTAMDLGRLAADEVIRAHLQAHGEMPCALVIDLWGSATLRTGGEEIAQGLALMGCRPTWDHATGRVTGIEVLPTASTGRHAST